MARSDRSRCARSITTPIQSVLQVSSLEGYGAPIIDIAHLLVGADLSQVVGTMSNFIPERVVRATGRMMRMNIDDGDIFIGEFANGALGSIQTSFVTVGNYPGIEARIYGSKGALICRLVEENGVCESLKAATADQVEFRELDVPGRFYPPGGSTRESWRSLFYAQSRAQLHRRDPVGRRTSNEGNFEDGAGVQEVINAVEQSFRERRWVTCRSPDSAARPGEVATARQLRAPPPTSRSTVSSSTTTARRPVKATFTGVHDLRRPAARLVAGRPRGRDGGHALRSTRTGRCRPRGR